jgi:hypothetical protein
MRFYVDPEFLNSVTRLFFLDREESVPTGFQSTLLLACGALLFLLGHLHQRTGEPSRAWKTMSAIFLALAFDESAAVHERTVGVMRQAFDLGGLLFFGWVVLGIAFVVAFVLAYARFLMRLDGRTRRSFVVAGLAYVCGAIGVEMISGAYVSVHGSDTPVYFPCVRASRIPPVSSRPDQSNPVPRGRHPHRCPPHLPIRRRSRDLIRAPGVQPTCGLPSARTPITRELGASRSLVRRSSRSGRRGAPRRARGAARRRATTMLGSPGER